MAEKQKPVELDINCVPSELITREVCACLFVCLHVERVRVCACVDTAWAGES